MLAFALAENIGLQNPYWAMVTCCVLSNPVSGAVRARATYRFCGTLFAGVLTLTISAFLSNTPQLLIIVAGLSSSLMLGISYLDRTPRAYFFQLGAITMMLVAIAYINGRIRCSPWSLPALQRSVWGSWRSRWLTAYCSRRRWRRYCTSV
nr:FUSC family protein [Mixta theicola]